MARPEAKAALRVHYVDWTKTRNGAQHFSDRGGLGTENFVLDQNSYTEA